MSRTLSSPTAAAVALAATQPAYLIQINWSTVAYLTTGATLTWGGHSWTSAAAELSGLSWKAGALQTATITLNNMAQEFSALTLGEGVADVAITIWAYDQTAVAAGDPVMVFSGVGGKCALNDNTVAIDLAPAGALKCPRLRVTPANGFNFLPANGAVIRWGNQRYVLAGRK